MGWKKRAKREQPEKPKGKRLDSRLIVIGVVLLAVALFAFKGAGGKDSPAKPSPARAAGEYTLFKNTPSTHEPGQVQMIVFFDFYCPHCHDFDTGLLPQIQAKYGERLKVTHVGYPIFGAKAVNPLRAYELAKDYGRGEEMKVAIFNAYHLQKKEISNTAVLASIAGEIGLDPEQFKRSLDGGAKNEAVQRNIALGESYSISQTPLVVLDGQYVVTKISLDNLNSIISSLMA